jgi:polyhydroxyalkanoate synthesis regulator phasin
MADESKRDMPFDMAGLIEKTFLMGIGVLEMTREKSSELADELVERGKMSKSEAKNVAESIGEMAEKQQEVMRDTVVKETDRAMKGAGFATKADVDALRAEIAELKLLIAGSRETPSTAPDPSANPDE